MFKMFAADTTDVVVETADVASKELDNIETILKKLTVEEKAKVDKILYGTHVEPLELPKDAIADANAAEMEIAGYKFPCSNEQLRPARVIRIGAFQNKLPLPTHTPVAEMRKALHKMGESVIAIAYKAKVNIFCFQELWHMPYAFCTREKQPWCEFAESAVDGPTIKFVQGLAKQYNMVIISPILERDELHGDTIWNTAVVVDNHGHILGRHRKNHIPRVTEYNESHYYFEGNTGHPVFETEFGRIAINICYGHHYPLNWFMFGVNGAEIVFNPSATVGDPGETMWNFQGRTAAACNGYYTVGVNRVGTEVFQNEFTTGDGKPAHKECEHFYGSSHVCAPNASKTPNLSRNQNGLLVTEVDLNLCRQVRDYFGFQKFQRLDMYADCLAKAVKLDYEPQIIKKK